MKKMDYFAYLRIIINLVVILLILENMQLSLLFLGAVMLIVCFAYRYKITTFWYFCSVLVLGFSLSKIEFHKVYLIVSGAFFFLVGAYSTMVSYFVFPKSKHIEFPSITTALYRK